MTRNDPEGFDIIGDVHGRADKLVQLLSNLGYERKSGVWRHARRQAVFVGDLIDRGPFQLDAVAIPRAMVNAGAAKMVLGNHEFNAVAYATEKTPGERDWCRPHNPHNEEQAAVLLAAAPFASPIHNDILEWFMDVPLWLDLDGVRVVHACWHDASIDAISSMTGPNGGLTRELVIEASKKPTDRGEGSEAYHAIETLLKGPEIHLCGYSYVDEGGKKRAQGRYDWWSHDAKTLRDAVTLNPRWHLVDPDGNPAEDLPDGPIPDDLLDLSSAAAGEATVFGHYWFQHESYGLNVIHDNAACVDFSAVAGGPLAAYRWSGEEALTSDNLVGAF